MGLLRMVILVKWFDEVGVLMFFPDHFATIGMFELFFINVVVFRTDIDVHFSEFHDIQ